MICNKCGTEIPENMTVCNKCGKPVENDFSLNNGVEKSDNQNNSVDNSVNEQSPINEDLYAPIGDFVPPKANVNEPVVDNNSNNNQENITPISTTPLDNNQNNIFGTDSLMMNNENDTINEEINVNPVNINNNDVSKQSPINEDLYAPIGDFVPPKANVNEPVVENDLNNNQESITPISTTPLDNNRNNIFGTDNLMMNNESTNNTEQSINDYIVQDNINPQANILNDLQQNSNNNDFTDEITTEAKKRNADDYSYDLNQNSIPKWVVQIILILIGAILVYFFLYPIVIKKIRYNSITHNWCCKTINSGSKCDFSLVLAKDDSFSIRYQGSSKNTTGKFSVVKSKVNVENDNKNYYDLKLDTFDSTDDLNYKIGVSSNKMIIYKNKFIVENMYCSINEE